MLKRGSNVHEILKFHCMRCIQCILVLRRRGRAKYYLIFVLEVTVVREQVENQVYRNLMPLVPALLLVADASFFIIGLVLLAFMVGILPLSSWSVP